MERKAQAICLAAITICILTALSLAETVKTKGQISKVIVYRGQALITRTINADLPAGTSELIIDSLPARIIPESIFAQTRGDTKVLSVRYREHAVMTDTRQEVKQLQQQIEALDNDLSRIENDLKLAKYIFECFDGQWKLSANAANVDLNRGVLNSSQIIKLTEFLETKASDQSQAMLELEFQKKEILKQRDLLKRKLAQLSAGRSRTERQAVLFIQTPDTNSNALTKSAIELNYLVSGANWQPQYNLRASLDNSNVLIEYNAVVNQTSGENWDTVELYLSTAEPTMIASPPALEPQPVEL